MTVRSSAPAAFGGKPEHGAKSVGIDVSNVSAFCCSVNNNAIFERAGFRNVRRGRGDWPFCAGHRHGTVALKDSLWFCHRCGRGGHVRQLARDLGVALPPPRIRLADIPKRAFREWLSAEMTRMADQERRLYANVRWARVALAYYPQMEAAWQALSEYYHRVHEFNRFWERASDRLGRFHLYREWRRNGSSSREGAKEA